MRAPTVYIPSFDETQVPILNNILEKIYHVLNNLEFGNTTSNENIWCSMIVVNTPAGADTAFYQAHALKKVPIGVIPIWKDKAADFYAVAGSAHTSTYVYLKCSAASCSAVLLII